MTELGVAYFRSAFSLILLSFWLIATKTEDFWYDFEHHSPVLWNHLNTSCGVLNKPHDALMCGFKPTPKSAKLLNELGVPFRQAENPPAEIGEIIFRYCPPGGIIIDPFCGTAPVAEQAMRQGKRVVLLDRDPLVLAAARTRHLQRYEYLKNNALLPKYYTVADTVTGNQSDREIAATESELKQVHWVQEVKMKGLDDRTIPKSNLPEERCEHPISIKKSLLVDDEAMAFASVSSSK